MGYMKLNHIRVLVTGGGRRIGAGICKTLAERGCYLIIHCNQSWREANLVAKHIEAKTCHRPYLIRKNLQCRNDCEQLIDEAWKVFAGLDVLINNVGAFSGKSLLATDIVDIDTQIRINYFVPVWLTEAFVSFFKKKRKSKSKKSFIPQIINMLDCRIDCPTSSFPAYIVAKTMLADFTIRSARILAPDIVVNGIAPGPVLPPVASENFACSIHVPAGKILTKSKPVVDDVVNAVIYLMESKVITGQVIYVDSGQHLVCI